MRIVAAARSSVLDVITLPSSFCAECAPPRSLTWIYVGMNAALNEPLMTEMASEGTINATRNASSASAVPKDEATTSTFAVETSFAPRVNEAITRVALKILRFVETFDQSVHFFMISCIHAFLA